jgi:hypothetical protein
MFSGFPRGSDSEIRKTQLEYLLDKQTVPALAAYGVRYVLVHKPDPGAPKIIPRPRQRIAGLQDIGGDSSAELYRVVARPATTSVFVAKGFNGIEGARPGQVSWLAQNGGHLELKAPCSPCVGTVDFGTGTFARPRTLTIRDPSGRVLFRRLIKTSAEHATVRLRFSRATVLYLSTDPPPDQVNKFVPGIDTRHFGVFVSLPVRLRVHQG